MTFEQLHMLLHYEPSAGIFVWNLSRGAIRSGTQAGSINVRGYLIIRIGRHPYSAHRLAWFYVHGTWPLGCLDHINRDKTDNRLSNLRLASISQNGANTFAQNRAKPKGVTFIARLNKWQAAICKDGRRQYIGLYETAEEGNAAYFAAAQRLFGEFASAS